MAELNTKSIKHAIIERNNSFIVGMVAAAVFVVIFCGFALNALVSQSIYQQRVISQKQDALDVLIDNKEQATKLDESYKAFASLQVNILSGSSTGGGPLDGDNPKIVLDALPSEYDYPGLSSSIEKILVDGGYSIESIGGREDSSFDIANQDDATLSKAEANPVAIPYPISVTASIESAEALLKTLENSIRPFKIQTLSLSSEGDTLSLNIGMTTYFQPETGLQVIEEVVK